MTTRQATATARSADTPPMPCHAKVVESLVRLGQEDLTSAQTETLRKLKAGELTYRQAEVKVDIGTKLARLLGAS